MAAVAAIQTVAIVLLGVLVVRLLRSHAEIQRKLHELGAGIDPDAKPGAVTTTLPAPARREAVTGFDLAGATPADEAVRIGVVGARQGTVLAFLSSGCLTCGTFWETFAGPGRFTLPGDARLVIVTKGPEAESDSRIRELAPPTVPVVMSTEAWLEYKVPHTPYFIYVDGPTGRIIGEGPAQTWSQVVSRWSQALADDSSVSGGGQARANSELAQARIHPDHESPRARSRRWQPPPDEAEGR